VSAYFWASLLGDASHALDPLFVAYEAQIEAGDQWLDKELAEFQDAAELRQAYDGIQRANVYAIAGCIALLADNIARFYAAKAAGSESHATRFGSVLKGIPFGEVLRVAGNSARHVPALAQTTVATLEKLGITRRDDSVPFQILELAHIRTMEGLIIELDIIASQIDQALFVKSTDPAKPSKAEPWMLPQTGRATPLG
jgi:hypothetical protein